MQVFSTRSDVPARTCLSLGRICVEFSLLEMQVDRTIYLLRNQTRKVGRVGLTDASITKRAGIIEREAAKRFGPKSQAAFEYAELAEKIRAIAIWRNTYVHGLWSRGLAKGDKNNWYVLSYFKDPKGLAEPVRDGDMVNLRRAIGKGINELEATAKRLLGISLANVP